MMPPVHAAVPLQPNVVQHSFFVEPAGEDGWLNVQADFKCKTFCEVSSTGHLVLQT